MDSETEKKFSFPDSDRYTANQKEQGAESALNRPRPVVHITDALNIEKKDGNDTRTIRTFQADIADAIKSDNVSMIKVALAEKKRQDTRGGFETAIEEKKSGINFYTASIGIAVVIVLGFVAFVYFGTKNSNSTQSQENSVSSLIYAETSTRLSINNRDSNDLERLFTRIKEEKFDLGTMKQIVLFTDNGTTSKQLGAQDFFQFMNTRASDSLIRSLDPNFFIGAYAFSNPYDTFAVFKVNSYDNVFAGMLQWEPSIDTDIGGLFISKRLIIPAKTTETGAVVGSGTSTSTATSTQPKPKRRVFVDKVVQNKDSRVLIDENGSTLMLYTFIDKETLVIASSDKSLKEVIFRLTTGRIIR